MKINISFFTLVFLILFLPSCKKDNSGSPAFHDSIPKIQTVTEYFNGEKERVTSFSYDASSRLVRVSFDEIYNNQKYYDTIIYNGATITMTTYDAKNKLIESEIFTLNSNQLAVLMTDTLGEQKKSSFRPFLDFSLQDHEANIYGYDDNGYQTLEISTNEFGGTHRYEKSYSNGNLVSSSYEYMANDTLIQSGASVFKYYTDKSNSIGNQNRGIPFLGKQNTNLLLSISDQKWHSYDTLRLTTSYRYEFDNQNRVVKQFVSPQNSENEDVTYLTFTYR
jgi:hypothetical protein